MFEAYIYQLYFDTTMMVKGDYYFSRNEIL